MKAAYLQFQPVLNDTEANIKQIAELTGKITESIDLLVMPELTNSGYLFTSLDEAM
ncbi:MAG TPA: 5-formyltetrahydrofolate cyclo-ligase, partial [Bacteroidetes bacterium]|nr:5-formyltetrahydrofolate cyclo-ligase [Bacteroidota bacterium]